MYLSVSDLVSKLSEKVKGEVQFFGEATNVHIHVQSGHLYLDLRDSKSIIKCVFFSAALSDFAPKNGQVCEVSGKVTVYALRGQMQVVLTKGSVIDKRGSQQQMRDKLLGRLSEAGILKRTRRQLPVIPQNIVIITSIGSAAHADISAGIAARWPGIRATTIDCRVQGREAPAAVVRAIQQGVSMQADVIICARGGGSHEDLEVFDHEDVVIEAANTPCPIVSAIGHQSDNVVLDAVADVVAKTPTAAIEIVVPMRQALLERLRHLGHNMIAAANARLTVITRDLARTAEALKQAPQIGVACQRQLLQKSNHVSLCRGGVGRHKGRLKLLRASFRSYGCITSNKTTLRNRALNIRGFLAFKMREEKRRLEGISLTLDAIDPQRTLSRGFIVATAVDGTHVVSSQQASNMESLSLQFFDGKVKVYTRI